MFRAVCRAPNYTRSRSFPVSGHNPSISPQSRRSLTHSASYRRAIPFSLNPYNPPQDDRDERVVRMLMFGKPGAGKGTLTARLAQKYDILTLSTGDLLRQHIADRTEVGQEAEAIVARGGLLPDNTVLKVVTSKLDALQNKACQFSFGLKQESLPIYLMYLQHWILDGFPRTIGQAELLNAHLKNRKTPLTLVVNLDVPDEVILSRISDRWVHLPSGRVYNMSYNRPKVEGFDDQTGEPLTKRPDDNPEIFARRLASFYTSTSPLVSYFKNMSDSSSNHRPNAHQHPHQLSFHRPSGLKVKTLSGRTSDEIWPHLDRLLQNTFPGLRERLETQENKRRQAVRNAITAELRTDSTSPYD
ncbi:adenylate kinase [Phlegmacium glaucopus]|nr:adenylate kinase [Phlegmacium glaucopus]